MALPNSADCICSNWHSISYAERGLIITPFRSKAGCYQRSGFMRNSSLIGIPRDKVLSKARCCDNVVDIPNFLRYLRRVEPVEGHGALLSDAIEETVTSI